jgi:hypothetical protein
MTTATRNPASPFAGSIEIDGVILYQAEDEPHTWLYLPGKPMPEMSGRGRPTLHLYVSPSGGILQLGAQWTVPPTTLDHLRSEIAQRSGQEEAEIRLQAALAAVNQATVEIGDGKGSSSAVATSASSGFPPFSAIFRASLDIEKKNAVVASLNGRAGFLTVRYQVNATSKVSAHATMKGDVSRTSEALTPSASWEQIIAWMNASVESGQISLTVEAIGNPGAALLSKAREMVVERFALALQKKLSLPESVRANESLLQVEALISELIETDLDRTADVSDWFDSGQAKDHITVLPGGDLGPQPP